MMKYVQKFVVSLIILTALAGLSSANVVREIRGVAVQGNTVIPESTILAQITSAPGSNYDPERISQDIQQVYDLGLFETVAVQADEMDGGVSLTFVVQERPFISKIEFIGNKHLKDERLIEVLTLAPDNLSDPVQQKFYPQKIQADIEQVKQLYHAEGYHHVEVVANLLPDPTATQEKRLLQYQIEERKKATVRKVNIQGNRAFSEKALRKTMETRKKGFFSFLTGSGKYEETTFETDLERLRFFYADHGYLDIKIVDYALHFDEESSDLTITITVEEGDIYTMETVGIAGNEVYTTEEIEEVIHVTPGDPFSRSMIRKDILAIADLYAQQGYVTPISEKTEGKLLIDPEIQVDRDHKTATLLYRLREGVPHALNRVAITGHQRTREKVIRRELLVYEGELLDSKKMERSQQRVFNLGFFEDVEFTLADGTELNTVDLTIDVTERSIGSFHFGGGYSSIDHFIVSGGVTYPNVFGLAHSIDLSAQLGGSSQQFNLSYTMPRFLDSHYLLGLDAYKTTREYNAYDSDSVGGGFRFGRAITENIFGTLQYEYKEVEISDVDEDASSIIQEAEGTSTTSSASLSFRRSTINNVLLPTRGMVTKLTGELAGGMFQGENDFYKLTLNNNIYFPLYKDFALRFKQEVAYAKEYGDSEKIPIFERFFAGGADTIRGYEERSVGPKDENGDEIGGNKRVLLTAELIIPIQKQLRFVTFLDAGDVYSSDEDVDLSTFRKGVGVGIRFNSPLGLLRLDWGYKLDKEPGESSNEFHFGLGGMF
ncbi:MAG: outer membrane protein assembly factor BamA [Candidatus Vecturithrix sp.]|jgi:outer membrane protein insertion porin family|nr:outer membrane protein assembly factor BamA [Candidatus Vecturithrix sp.]